MRTFVLTILAAILVAGCAAPSTLMKEVPEEEPVCSPSAGKTMVIFLRPSTFGFAVQAKVIDVTSEENPQLVGIVGAKTKVAYETDPGERIFMVVGGENTPFLEADLEAGKTYYARINPLIGFLYVRFGIKPIRGMELDGDEFNKWNSTCTLYTNSEESYLWAEENLEKIRDKRARKLPEWLEKPRGGRDDLTLKPDDGR